MTTRATRTTRTLAAAVGALCLAAVPALAVAHPGHGHGDRPDRGERPDRGDRNIQKVFERGELTDLRPDVDDPTDGARAAFVALSAGDRTSAVLVLRGLDAERGTTLGVHVHTGPCVAGDGAAAGPHYNHDVATGAQEVRVNPQTEVWLDSTVGPRGASVAATRVPFTVQPGTRSVVVHERATAEDGTAGERLACLPVEF